MPVKLCCPSRMASRSGYVNGKGLSPGLLSVRDTTSLGLVSPGTGFNNAELIQLKIVVFAPIPSASVRMAIAANPGALASARQLYRTSCQNEVIPTPFREEPDWNYGARLPPSKFVLWQIAGAPLSGPAYRAYPAQLFD